MHILCAHCYTNYTTSHHLHDSPEEVVVLTLQTLQLLAQHVCAAEWWQQQWEHDAFEVTTLILSRHVSGNRCSHTPAWHSSSSSSNQKEKQQNKQLTYGLVLDAQGCLGHDQGSLQAFHGCVCRLCWLAWHATTK